MKIKGSMKFLAFFFGVDAWFRLFLREMVRAGKSANREYLAENLRSDYTRVFDLLFGTVQTLRQVHGWLEALLPQIRGPYRG